MRICRLQVRIIIFGLLTLTFGCQRSKNKVPDSMLTGQVTIASDEALSPLMTAEIAVFKSIYTYSSVNCRFVSEYDAINLLLQEKIRLAIVTRPLNQKEIDYLVGIKIQPESIPLAYDAIAVAVHPENKIPALTTHQISDILNGHLTDWGQIKASGLKGTIKLVFDTEASGIIRSLNDSLKLNDKVSGNIQFAGSNKNTIEAIELDKYAIGFLGYNWISERESQTIQQTLKKMNLVAISSASIADSTNSFQPTIATLFNLEYPLTRKIYAIYTDPSASLARGMLAHLTSERGQKIIYRMGLKPENDFQRLVNIKEDN